jgi:hypothetical protein
MKGRPDLTEDARQWAMTFLLVRVAVVLTGLGAFLLARRLGMLG